MGIEEKSMCVNTNEYLPAGKSKYAFPRRRQTLQETSPSKL